MITVTRAKGQALLDIDINVVHIAELGLADLGLGLQTLSIKQEVNVSLLCCCQIGSAKCRNDFGYVGSLESSSVTSLARRQRRAGMTYRLYDELEIVKPLGFQDNSDLRLLRLLRCHYLL